jgi:tellurite resistance protein TehA-like permease
MSNAWLLFVLGTVVCWGAYGPSIHEGQMALGKNALKAFLCVGAAYFAIAVIAPVVMIKAQGGDFAFTARGAAFALAGGALGAAGALGIILALKNGGRPEHVMPLVFGGAPVVNVLVSMALHPPEARPSPFLYLGFLVLASGAGMVLYFKPK